MKYVDLKAKNEEKISSLSVSKGTSSKKVLIFLVIIVVAVIGLSTLLSKKVSALFNPISIVANFKKNDLKDSDGRTNILLLGTDGRTIGNIQSKLTDTIMVASIGKSSKDVVLISIPRDLWVQGKIGSYQGKINAMYTYGGIEETKAVVEDFLGIPVHYYGVTGFELFKDAVDIAGGIIVNVEHSFTDYEYPIEGKEDAPEDERYEVVHFDAGVQTMSGDKALKYVRSRKSADSSEGTDFARSKRQQNVILALKDKLLSPEILLNPLKLRNLYDTYVDNVETNIDLGATQSLVLVAKDLDFSKTKSLIIDDRSDPSAGGLLYVPENRDLYGGAYVLVPRQGTFDQVHAYVHKYLFEAQQE